MFYRDLKNIADDGVRTRTVEGLIRLRAALDKDVPRKTATNTLLLATWNIREFDSGKYGYREQESYFYIAEILSRFDLIAVQEVKDGLYPLQAVTKILGSSWDYLVTDVTLGTSGNIERMAFLYDKRKVSFTGLAAELVLEKKRGEKEEPRQFARSPYIAGFRAGWAYFTLLTVHIYYGEGKALDPRRLQEIQDFAATAAKHADKFNSAPQRKPGVAAKRNNLIMLGDFNIFKTPAAQEAASERPERRSPATLSRTARALPACAVASRGSWISCAHPSWLDVPGASCRPSCSCASRTWLWRPSWPPGVARGRGEARRSRPAALRRRGQLRGRRVLERAKSWFSPVRVFQSDL
jgi:hypothetical protein